MANYITHIIKQELPKAGLRKVAFYTKNEENHNSGEYFFGIDNNPIDYNVIEDLIIAKKVFRVNSEIKLYGNQTLYVDSNENYYLADNFDNNLNRKIIIQNVIETISQMQLILNEFSRSFISGAPLFNSMKT